MQTQGAEIAPAISATEDAAARSVIAGQAPRAMAGCVASHVRTSALVGRDHLVEELLLGARVVQVVVDDLVAEE